MTEAALWTAEAVIAALEEAMITLRALPHSGFSTRLSTLKFEIPPDAWPTEPSGGSMRLPIPKPAAITKMDAVLLWIAYIPADRIVLRKLVARRATTHHASGRPMSWRRIAGELHTDPAAVKRWHGQAIEILVRQLNSRRNPAAVGLTAQAS